MVVQHMVRMCECNKLFDLFKALVLIERLKKYIFFFKLYSELPSNISTLYDHNTVSNTKEHLNYF